jgi:cyclic pyranopterin phosphate synthase
VRFDINDEEHEIAVEAEVRACGRTGVEMEAIVAVQIAAAALYDMCKSVQRDISIGDVRLVYKSGGRSGIFDRRGS